MKMMSYIINFFIYTVLGFVLMGVGIGLFSLTTKFSERELIRQGNIAVALKLWGKGIGLAIVIYAAWSNSVSLLDAVMWGAIGIITQILAYLALEYIFTPKTNLAKKVEEGNLAVGFSLFAISIIVGLIVAGSMSY
jgi:putative membrane protein